jgi:hypothetical protein
MPKYYARFRGPHGEHRFLNDSLNLRGRLQDAQAFRSKANATRAVQLFLKGQIDALGSTDWTASDIKIVEITERVHKLPRT